MTDYKTHPHNGQYEHHQAEIYPTQNNALKYRSHSISSNPQTSFHIAKLPAFSFPDLRFRYLTFAACHPDQKRYPSGLSLKE